jgi:hypothetical protein
MKNSGYFIAVIVYSYFIVADVVFYYRIIVTNTNAIEDWYVG